MDSEKVRALVERAKDGDRKAFDALIGEYRGRLRSRVESWVPQRAGPGVDVDEVLQETLVRALSGLKRFVWKDDDAFFRWLCGVARYALATANRKARKEAARIADAISTTGLPGSDVSQSRVVRRDERFQRLEEAIEKLPPDYRQVLILHQIEGIPLKEIARRMGRTPNAVQHLHTRAQDELRRLFGETESFHLPDRPLQVDAPPAGE